MCFPVTIDGGTLTDVSAIKLSAPTNGTKLYWIEVDGKQLTEHTSIGADASGRGNHFNDRNFQHKPVVTYTGNFTTSDVSAIFENGLFNGTISPNGQQGIKWDKTGGSSTASMTLTTPITTSGTITAIYNGAGNGRTIGFNSQAAQTFISGSGSTFRETTLNCPTSITSIQFADANDQGATALLAALKVNGKLLTDMGGVDQVVDTPIRNYANKDRDWETECW